MTAVPVPAEPTDRLRRGLESAAEAGAALALAVLPGAWHTLDGTRTAALIGVFMLLTAAIYALHTVTFDCLRLVAGPERGKFSGPGREK